MKLAAEGLVIVKAGQRIIDGVSLSASDGEFIGLVGPNGAGKSTLLRALCGIEKVQSGRVALDNADISEMAPRDLARARAYLPQQRDLAWSQSVEAVIALGRFAYGSPERLAGHDRDAVARALAATRLNALRERDAHTLSGGEAARMHLARALAAEAPILIVDEPTSALDPRCRLEVMDILAAKARAGGLVIAALHDLDLAARFCGRLVVIDRGLVVADGPPATALDAARLHDVFGIVDDGRGFRLAQ